MGDDDMHLNGKSPAGAPRKQIFIALPNPEYLVSQNSKAIEGPVGLRWPCLVLRITPGDNDPW
jgi:hypothetical protein